MKLVILIVFPPLYLAIRKRYGLACLTFLMFCMSALFIIAPVMYVGALIIALFEYKKAQKESFIKEHADATGAAVAKALSQQRNG